MHIMMTVPEPTEVMPTISPPITPTSSVSTGLTGGSGSSPVRMRPDISKNARRKYAVDATMRVAPMAFLSIPCTSSAPIACTSHAPRYAVGTEPMISQRAILRLGFPCLQCTPAPTTLLTALTTRSLATAAVGGMPTRMSAGVMSAPPPIPVRPITTPMTALTTSRPSES